MNTYITNIDDQFSEAFLKEQFAEVCEDALAYQDMSMTLYVMEMKQIKKCEELLHQAIAMRDNPDVSKSMIERVIYELQDQIRELIKSGGHESYQPQLGLGL